MTVLAVEQIFTNCAVCLALACCAIIVLQRPSHEQRLAVAYIVFSLITVLGYLMIMYSKAYLQMLVYGTKLKYLGSVVMGGVVMLLFDYFKVKSGVWLKAFFLTSMFLLLFMACVFDSKSLRYVNHWLYTDYSSGLRDGIPVLHKVYGWGHTFYVVMAIVLFACTTFVFARVLVTNHAVDKTDIIILYCVIVLPQLSYLLEKLLIRIAGHEPIPVVPTALMVSDVLLVYLIAIRKFCDVNVLANNVVFDMVNTPALVLDRRYRLININDTALRLFPEINSYMIGRNAFNVLPLVLSSVIQDLVAEEKSLDSSQTMGNSAYIPCGEKVFQPKICRISSGRFLYGYVVWLEDVTLLHTYKDQLERDVETKTLELVESVDKMRTMRDQMVLGFSSLAEHHDLSSKGHLHRTAGYTKAIAQELFDEGLFRPELCSSFVEKMCQVAPLHDIGKTYIDKEIFNKAGKLTEAEYRLMQQHTTMGANFIESTMKDNVDMQYVKMAHDVALYHHEWWDGSGYPYGLSGTDIPLCARIMAVADNYDALVTKRPYKDAFSSELAYEIIRDGSGVHFDPAIVDAFNRIRPAIEAITELYASEDEYQGDILNDC